MNEIFKKSKSKNIELEKGFYLKPDGFKGLILLNEVEKTRINKISKESETYTAIEQYYFPKISQTLMKYLELKSVEAKSVEDLKDIVLRVENKINSIKEMWD